MRRVIGASKTFGTRSATFRRMLSALAFVLATAAWAEEVTVEGRALIGPEGIAAARELAIRRALARAAQSHSARVSAQSSLQAGTAFETAQVSASACTQETGPLAERVEDGELAVTLRVEVGDCGAPQENAGGDGASACEKTYINRLLVAGFAFEFPEQLPEEWDGRLLPRVNRQRIEALTATELARALEHGGRVRAVFDGELFPYASPSRAPALHVPAGTLETPLVALAREWRAQYVLSGIYREFGLEKSLMRHERPIEIEAFLHDGANGAVLARQHFQTEVSSSIWSSGIPRTPKLPNVPTIGTRAFRETPFGEKWTALIGEIARWASAQASCLPFIARVMKVEGRLLRIDAGAESRMNVGDTLTLHLLRKPPVLDLSAHLLGQEKQVRATVTLRAIYPAFSIAELIETPEILKVNPGDFVYAE
ncbi:MAG: flagellar assembly protein T N-terminal domain-containing protein [Candidatus Accumulibacter sp.]|jgi:hypothetical protein|nr:flagellar assembly protein T N-terminal domain-containing protein [Accumulibacter sp.]